MESSSIRTAEPKTWNFVALRFLALITHCVTPGTVEPKYVLLGYMDPSGHTCSMHVPRPEPKTLALSPEHYPHPNPSRPEP